jgi:hypothetical protein
LRNNKRTSGGVDVGGAHFSSESHLIAAFDVEAEHEVSQQREFKTTW